MDIFLDAAHATARDLFEDPAQRRAVQERVELVCGGGIRCE
jgi:hypothetical protein